MDLNGLFYYLGATSVLSVVNIGFGGKSRPQVGYATALDTFIILCFFAVFAALVEFACINFIDTFVKRRKIKQESLKKVANETQAKVEIIQEIVAGTGNFFGIKQFHVFLRINGILEVVEFFFIFLQNQFSWNSDFL